MTDGRAARHVAAIDGATAILLAVTGKREGSSGDGTCREEDQNVRVGRAILDEARRHVDTTAEAARLAADDEHTLHRVNGAQRRSQPRLHGRQQPIQHRSFLRNEDMLRTAGEEAVVHDAPAIARCARIGLTDRHLVTCSGACLRVPFQRRHLQAHAQAVAPRLQLSAAAAGSMLLNHLDRRAAVSLAVVDAMVVQLVPVDRRSHERCESRRVARSEKATNAGSRRRRIGSLGRRRRRRRMRLLLVAAAALVRRDTTGVVRVLLAQRPEGKALAGLWEFPGGKLEPGEKPEACLARELCEELGIDVSIEDLTPLTFASHPIDDSTHLLMPLWSVSRWKGEPRGAEGQALSWITSAELGADEYAMPPADYPLVPVVRRAMATMDEA